MKVGFAAVIGKPNVGKTTLINRLVGTKLGGVSPKPQTTRHRILGLVTARDFQVGFIDTPGALERKINELQKLMDARLWSAAREADVVLMITGPTRPDSRDMLVINHLRDIKKPVLLVLNKADTVEKSSLLPVIQEYSEIFGFAEIIPISARRGYGLDRVLAETVRRLPEGEPLYPEGEVSDRNLRFFASEIIREKIFLRFRKEVPYAVAVAIEEFQENSEPVHIRAVIYVEKKSQKPIILGKGGKAIKEIGTLAREELEFLLGKKVFLELWVKVKPGWRRDRNFLRGLGI